MQPGKDDLSTRLSSSKLSSREVTQGVTTEGFQDATGEFPKEEYLERTSINKAATGDKVNKVYVGGGDLGVDIPYTEQKESVYPFNQVKETASGHVIEYDDTPGGERILIKHKSGSGIEMKPDGSIVIVSKTNSIQVCNGTLDVIVEGDTNLVYKGDLDVQVEGNYNLTVDGNSTTNIHGDNISHVRGYNQEIIDKYMETYIQDYQKHYVGTTQHVSVENEINYFTTDHVIKSTNFYHSATNMDVFSDTFDHTVNTFNEASATKVVNVDNNYDETTGGTYTNIANEIQLNP